MLTISDKYEHNFIKDGFREEILNKDTPWLVLNCPYHWSSKDLFTKINPAIFSNSLIKAPNIHSLIITELKGEEVELLKPLIELFHTNYPKNLQDIELTVPQADLGGDHLKPDIEAAYKKLLKAIRHTQLTSLKIIDKWHVERSDQIAKSLKRILKKSPNLKNLSLQREDHEKITIPFNICINLEKVELNGIDVTEETWSLLKKCKKVNEIILEGGFNESFAKILRQNHAWNLRVLTFKTSVISTDYDLYKIFAQLPYLESFGQNHFSFNSNHITDEGLELLFALCPNITSFFFAFNNITDEGFSLFAKYAKNLQKLKTEQAFNLGEKALIALGTHCTRLKYLELVHWKNLTREGFKTLATGCKMLEYLGISFCKKVSFSGLEYFIQNSSNLKGIYVLCTGETKEDHEFEKKEMERLEKKYPHIKWGSHYSFYNQMSLPLEPSMPLTRQTVKIPPNLLNGFLLEAIRNDLDDEIKYFLELGANANAFNVLQTDSKRVEYEENPVILASLKGKLETVQLLHSLGGNLKVMEKFLGGLSQPRHLEVLKYLLRNGCDPNVVGQFEFTPLQAMALKQRLEPKMPFSFFTYRGATYDSVCLDCLKELVKYRADIKVRLEGMYTLSFLAKKSKNTDVYKYFHGDLGIKKNTSEQRRKENQEMQAWLEEEHKKLKALDLQKKQFEEKLAAPIYEVLKEIMLSIISKTWEFGLVSDMLSPKRGIYYLKGKSDDTVESICYRRCLQLMDDCMQELKKEKREEVLKVIASYDPYSEAIIATPAKKFYIIRNVDGFSMDESSVEEIIENKNSSLA